MEESNLADVGSFCVQPTPREPRYDDDAPLPSHRLVLDPILRAAVHARLVGEVRDPLIAPLLGDVSVPRRGHVELDLSRELVRGRERLWNASGRARGAIVVVCEPTRVELGEIFHYCDGPWTWASRYLLVRHSSRAATRFADSVAAEGKLAFLFSASNGLDWLDIFVPGPLLDAAFGTALKECRRFKRYIEHNPGATDEIIVDRPPYSDVR